MGFYCDGFYWMIMVNGFIIDARRATYEIQEQAYNAGIIPTDDVAKISWHGRLYAVPIEVMERYKIMFDDQYTPDSAPDFTNKHPSSGLLNRSR